MTTETIHTDPVNLDDIHSPLDSFRKQRERFAFSHKFIISHCALESGDVVLIEMNFRAVGNPFPEITVKPQSAEQSLTEQQKESVTRKVHEILNKPFVIVADEAEDPHHAANMEYSFEKYEEKEARGLKKFKIEASYALKETAHSAKKSANMFRLGIAVLGVAAVAAAAHVVGLHFLDLHLARAAHAILEVSEIIFGLSAVGAAGWILSKARNTKQYLDDTVANSSRSKKDVMQKKDVDGSESDGGSFTASPISGRRRSNSDNESVASNSSSTDSLTDLDSPPTSPLSRK